jgi:hypothetical protein
MPRYHFNPATGRPSICKATQGKCPFLLEGAGHYDTKEEARAAIERFYSEPYVSVAGRLAVLRSRVQREITKRFSKDRKDPSLKQLISERNTLQDSVYELEQDPSEETPKLKTKPMKLVHGELNKDLGHQIVGFTNELETLQTVSSETEEAGVAISEVWVSQLRTEEVKLMLRYTSHPATAQENPELFDKALRKAPPLEPTTVYSGLSRYVAEDVLKQLDSGIVDLDYPISSSLNAGQTNGFMRHIGTDEELNRTGKVELIALEIETTTGAPLMALSTSLHEFEVLLPSGSYEVIGVRKDVQMLWGEGGSGREASKLIKLRRLP